MPADPVDSSRGGIIRRTWRSLTSPSARWSVLALLLVGIAIGFAAVVGTQVMVYVTGTDKFCGTTCHSHEKWVSLEHKQSVHMVNRTGFRAGCHDCHIPHDYPAVLWYKAKAGTRDVIAEMQGILSTKEKFEKERLRMAKHVWDEYKANDSRACRGCHQLSKEMLPKMKEEVRPIHEAVLAGNGTCIDCHKGVAHTAPTE